MTKEEIRNKIFNLKPGDKLLFLPQEYKDARAAIAAARKAGSPKIVSALIGSKKSVFEYLSVYCPRNEGEKIVSADIKISVSPGFIPAAVIGTDTLTLKQAVIDYRQGSIRLHDLIQIA